MVEPSLTKAAAYAVASAVSVSLGKGFQKYGVAAVAHPRLYFRTRENTWQLVVWLLGTGGLAASALFLFAACAYGPVTVVAALSGTGLIALVAFSAFVLKEKIGAAEYAGVALIVAGSFAVGYFDGWSGATGFGLEPSGSARIDRRHLVVFSLAVAAASLGLAFFGARKKGAAFGAVFGSIAGFCGGLSVFYQKASMIHCDCSDIFADIPAALHNPFFHLFIVGGLLDFAVTQVALSGAKAVTVVPSYQSFYLVVPIIGGVLVYYERVNAVQLAGAALLFGGVLLLSRFVARSIG
ncbi:MAG: hypothetical protein M5R36_15385 [Deltaproteobacteria bacterium]|nr:hypothetical protein [Deltaproteobacteria bacterium]